MSTFSHARNANDLYEFLLHRLPELREPEHQAGLGIGDLHPPWLDPRNVAQGVSVQLIVTAHRAHGPEARCFRRRVARSLHSVFVPQAIIGEGGAASPLLSTIAV